MAGLKPGAQTDQEGFASAGQTAGKPAAGEQKIGGGGGRGGQRFMPRPKRAKS